MGSRIWRIAAMPDAVWAPLMAGLLTLVPALVGLATGRLLLFPSLGPTALLQAYSPEDPSARFYNVVLSHLGGMLSGYLAVFLFGIPHAPSVFELGQLTVARIGAAVLAMVLATWMEWLFRAKHAPAASTTLLVALGSFKPTPEDAAAVVLGVLSVAIVGELFRRLRLEALDREAQDAA